MKEHDSIRIKNRRSWLRFSVPEGQEGKLSLSMKVLAEQQADREEHETFDYKETGTVSTGLGDLLKGLKL